MVERAICSHTLLLSVLSPPRSCVHHPLLVSHFLQAYYRRGDANFALGKCKLALKDLRAVRVRDVCFARCSSNVHCSTHANYMTRASVNHALALCTHATSTHSNLRAAHTCAHLFHAHRQPRLRPKTETCARSWATVSERSRSCGLRRRWLCRWVLPHCCVSVKQMQPSLMSDVLQVCKHQVDEQACVLCTHTC